MVAQAPTGDHFLADGEAISVEEICNAIQALAAALPPTGAPPVVRVAVATADSKALAQLRAAGASAIEWAVRAPTPASAQSLGGNTAEFEQLIAALQTAKHQRLPVRLRWRVQKAAEIGLSDLHALAQRAPTGTQLVIQPALNPAQAPNLQSVLQNWPKQMPATPELLVLRSTLWPVCVAKLLPQRDTPPRGQIDAAKLTYVAGCDGCPHRAQRQCEGVPTALFDAQTPDEKAEFGWRLKEQTHAAPTTAPPLLRWDENCVELRGIVLGLRRAWRLSVPAQDVPLLRERLQALGLQVAISTDNLALSIGGHAAMASAEQSGTALFVVAKDADLAKQCLAAELSNIGRKAPQTRQEHRDYTRQTLEVHRFLGAAYGYPRCCVESFCDAHAEIVHLPRQGDNAIALLRSWYRSQSFDSRLDTLTAGLGDLTWSPLRHLPCRFDCKPSIELAEKLNLDRQVCSPEWFAKWQARVPEAVVAFADGSLLRVTGQLQAADAQRTTVLAVAQASVRVGGQADALRAQVLQALVDHLDWQGMIARSGQPLRVLRGEAWQEVDLPADNAPFSDRFPILLPFA